MIIRFRLLGWLLLSILFVTSAKALELAGRRPNIVLIMADDMGWSDLGCYGGEIDTPQLDSLAANGLRFTQFYNCGKCAPTRASLLSGLYHHQVGVHGVVATMRNCLTLGEVLGDAGYTTLYSGKWHANQSPKERGFDRSFAMLGGAGNYWNPGEQRPGEPVPHHGPLTRKSEQKGQLIVNSWELDDVILNPYTPEDPDFYTTDAFTDQALSFLEAQRNDGKPFFLYLPYTAPHWPLHAHPEDIAKYQGQYREGWQHYRDERYRRQLEMGLIDTRWQLTDFDRQSQVNAWEELSEEEKDFWDMKMAVYAAMVDRMDQNIGRVVQKLKEMEVFEDTLICFLSDNGNTKSFYNYTDGVPIGPLDSYYSLDQAWANVSNTPYREFKSSDHEGGVCTPMIAHWPAGITGGGRVTEEVGQVMDFMPTLLELAGVEYPDQLPNGKPLAPMEGKSLLPIFADPQYEHYREIFFCHAPNLALRKGPWKLVKYRKAAFELFYIKEDHSEMHDLSELEPEILQDMKTQWYEWALRLGVQLDDLLLTEPLEETFSVHPIETWLEGWGMSGADRLSNEDGDQWPVLAEYLIGGNPGQINLWRSMPPLFESDSLGIGLVSERDHIPPGLHVTLEGSDDLGLVDPWTRVPTTMHVSNHGDGSWILRFVQDAPLGSGGKRFVRLAFSDYFFAN